MKKLAYLLALIAFLSFASCEKNEPVLTECQKQNIGYITFENNSKHAFDIWINNKYYKQQPGKTIAKNIVFDAGKSYTIDVKQVAGYIFYPTEKRFDITLNMCDEKTIIYTD